MTILPLIHFVLDTRKQNMHGTTRIGTNMFLINKRLNQHRPKIWATERNEFALLPFTHKYILLIVVHHYRCVISRIKMATALVCSYCSTEQTPKNYPRPL